MKLLSIVVPCYNESKNISLILKRFKDVIDTDEIEVILVDNGSTDNSSEIFAELLPKYLFAKLIKVSVNQGYGFGIISGLRVADGEYVGWTHADMQTDPSDVIKTYEIVKRRGEKKIYVKGSRKERSFFDLFFTLGMSFFETLYLRSYLWDINAQPNIFHRDFFKDWKNPPYDFSLDLYALYMARKKGLKIIRFPVLFPQRIYGVSSWNRGVKSKFKFIKRTFIFSVQLKRSMKNDICSSSN